MKAQAVRRIIKWTYQNTLMVEYNTILKLIQTV